MRTCDFCRTVGHDALDCPNLDAEQAATIRAATRRGLRATTPRTCDNCGEPSTTTAPREYGMDHCDRCHAAQLAYGHAHGLHVDEDGAAELVAGCPSCPGAPVAESDLWALGVVVSAMNAALFPEEDWTLASYGDCTELVARAQARTLDRIAVRHGFTNAAAVYDAVEARTSPRWAHFHLAWGRAIVAE